MEKEDVGHFLRCGAIARGGHGVYLLGWGEQTHHQESPEGSPAYYRPDFFLKDPFPWITYENMMMIDEGTLRSLLKQFISEVPLLTRQNLQPEPYQTVFIDLKRAIERGTLKKGVPYASTIFEGEWTVARIARTLLAALEGALLSPLFVYGFWNNDEGMIGATPELLCAVDLEKKTVETVALAGTMGDHLSQEAFLNDPKERAEHEFVVEGIEASFIKAKSFERGSLSLAKAGKLVHLKTLLKITFEETLTIQEVIDRLHPTPALGAFPKEEGKKWLESVEKKLPRKRFGAPFGAVHGDKAEFYVAIRGIQWEGKRAQLIAGGGVVAQSFFENEWKEIQKKMTATAELLHLV